MLQLQAMPLLNDAPRIIAAIGGLGTAAFGLVDATKTLGPLSVNRIGFGAIGKTVQGLTPAPLGNALPQAQILATLKANWFNGTDLATQKSIAKSLIKLSLNQNNAAALANATGVNPAILTQVAANIAAGTALSQAQSDVYARFDLIVTALLDETYQCSDNTYRNWTRFIAGLFAIILAVLGGLEVNPPAIPPNWHLLSIWHQLSILMPNILLSVLIGVLAVPLAPIAKDISTALATAVNTMQLVKKSAHS